VVLWFKEDSRESSFFYYQLMRRANHATAGGMLYFSVLKPEL